MAVKGKKAERIKKSKTKPTKSVSLADQEQQVLEIGGAVEPPEEEQQLIKNDQFAVEFVRPRFEKTKHGHIVGFDFSVNLAEGHQKFVPKKVWLRYREVLGGGIPRIDMSDIKPQIITVALFPEDGRPTGSEVTLEAMISRARVQEILSKGNGKETRAVRFSFTAYVEQDKDIVTFAAWKHESLCWLTMKDHQGELSFMQETEEEAAGE